MPIDHRDFIYDVETYPNFFSLVATHRLSSERHIFEVSDWVNHAPIVIDFLMQISHHDARMIGFNNCGFDYQILHHLIHIGTGFTAQDAYQKTDFIINKATKDEQFKARVWDKNFLIKQIDLYLIHHFNNKARATSLKQIEVRQRSKNVGDLPYSPGQPLTYDQSREVLHYNCHDVFETGRFADFSQDRIEFREQLVPDMGIEVMNYDDTKIGKKYIEQRLRKNHPGILAPYGQQTRQTPRESIHLGDIILPYIEFETPQLQQLLMTLKNTTITRTNKPPELEGLSATLGGRSIEQTIEDHQKRFDINQFATLDNFTVHAGAGGGHGSVPRQVIVTPPGWRMVDADVGGYYPALAIVNKFYPQHLTSAFCDIYENVYKQRKATPKKTAPNEMLKLALNGVYGDSGNKFSIYYDPQYTMSITINGQLLLYLLMEKIMQHTNGKMIQLNTDGITFLIRNDEVPMMEKICKWWEDLTQLELEYADYSRMWIRDVNNYMAEYTDGKLKRIGAYAVETARENPATREVGWQKNHDALVIQKAVQEFHVNGTPVEQFIQSHQDAFDFMLSSKATGKTRTRLMRPGDADAEPVGDRFTATAGVWLQRVNRYYVAHTGDELQMIHAPLKSKPEYDRVIRQQAGWNVKICNDLSDFDPMIINYDWYIAEARKLCIV